MDLVPYMYYEQQEPGSQLCAQHCLNNILQQYTYSEFDLAEIAKKLDQAENAALAPSNQNKKSYNLDDTGFFSISVLERALEVWDLQLVRWRGEAMKPYQEHPEEQAAFILNLSSHWLPLRRFSTHPPQKSASKRWYNLNSFLPGGPEWISPTYLRLVLAQAEEEGYSVFVIRKAGHGGGEGLDTAEGQGWRDGGVGVLPECEADRIAVVLGEPVGRTGAGNSGGMQSATSATGQGSAGPSRPTTTSVDQPTIDDNSNAAGPSSPPARRRRRQEDLTPAEPLPAEEEQFSRPAPRSRQLSRGNSTPALAPPLQADVFDSQGFPSIDDDEPMHTGPGLLDDEHGEHDEAFDLDDGEDSFARYGTNRAGAEAMHGYGGPTDFAFNSRSYDDEDEALQAALKASMADIPEGWVAPEITKEESKAAPAVPTPPLVSPATPAGTANPGVTATAQSAKEELVEDEDDDDDGVPTEELTADEIRRRRLARFGL